VQGGVTKLQGILAGWISILFMAALFVDENLRHAMPAALGVSWVAVVLTSPIWVPIILDNKHKKEKTKKQVVEIEVLK